MKKYFLLLFCILQSIFALAQTSEKTASDYKFAFKAYSNVSILKNSTGHNMYYWGIPTFALQWKAGKKNWQDLKLSAIGGGYGTERYNNSATQTADNQRRFYGYLAAEYEYNWNFLKKAHRLTPSVGFGAGLGLNLRNSHSLDILNNYFSYGIALKAFITPRLVYNFTPRVFGDLNLPIQIYSPGIQFTHTKTDFANTNNTSFANSLSRPTFIPRIGVGYRF